jgi:hypothetical protein
MKTLNIILSKTVYSALIAICCLSFSCEGPPGEDGSDGMDGINGVDGQNGENGNANVTTYTFDISGEGGSFFSITFPELTGSVLQNDVVLTYLKRSNSRYYQAPGISFNHHIEVQQRIAGLDFFFYELGSNSSINVNVGQYLEVKAIIIKSTATGRSASFEDPLRELDDAGVDTSSYEEVCRYYGIPL